MSIVTFFLQNSSLIAGLTAKEQTFVKKMMSMGFEAESTVRAMQQFGLDDKEVRPTIARDTVWSESILLVRLLII